MKTPKKIFILVNVDWFFLSHRLPIALSAHKAGYDITIVTSDSGRIQEIGIYGLKYIKLPLNRASLNPFKELKIVLFLCKLYLKEKPLLVHHVGLKLFLYGSIAAKIFKIPTINAMSGLGYLFSNTQKFNVLKKMIFKTLNYFFKSLNAIYVFQNHDDKNLILSYLPSINKQDCIIIKGSGVDIKDFAYTPEYESEKTIILLLSRMLWDKGIKEYVSAAKLIKHQLNGTTKFLLVGPIDRENPMGISHEELNQFEEKDYIEWVGYKENIKEVISQSNVVVLPSYREGLPKSLIEACAIGRAIITTDAPGCRDVVEEGVNGFLVPIKDSELLSKRILQLVNDKKLRSEMGINARMIAEREFSLDYVISEHLMLYKKVLNGDCIHELRGLKL